MDICQFIFSESQENLVKPMPWGDEHYSGNARKPTVITDESILLLSGKPPYFEGDMIIAFRYDAPHAKWVEWGTPPHAVAASRLEGWCRRKLGKRGKDVLRTAYAVAGKIRIKGIEPHPYIRPAVNTAVKKFRMRKIRSDYD